MGDAFLRAQGFFLGDRGETPRLPFLHDISSMISGNLPVELPVWGEMSLRGETPRFWVKNCFAAGSGALH
jgi:hypothetical protein